jgi:hypothetical protein
MAADPSVSLLLAAIGAVAVGALLPATPLARTLGSTRAHALSRGADDLGTLVDEALWRLAVASADVTELVPGDVVDLQLGEVVPADVRLLAPAGLRTRRRRSLRPVQKASPSHNGQQTRSVGVSLRTPAAVPARYPRRQWQVPDFFSVHGPVEAKRHG